MTHIAVIICRTPHFISTQSIFRITWLNTDFFSEITIKSPSVTQISVSQETVFEKSKTPSAFFFFFFSPNYRFNISFTLIETISGF